MARKLISEQTVLDCARRGEKTLALDDGTIMTDAARDRARQLGIRIEHRRQQPASSSAETPSHAYTGKQEVLAIGSDHGGFAMKESLKPFIEKLGYKVVDLGTYSEEACDYPDFAYAVARMVSLGQASKGIMIDAVGIASAMVANKIKGVRAACCTDDFSARSSREHNDANVLTLGGRVVGSELAKSIVAVWLQTNFGGGRHQKRVEKIKQIENRPQS
jgi:ribose 5-phosphate isomerase B